MKERRTVCLKENSGIRVEMGRVEMGRFWGRVSKAEVGTGAKTWLHCRRSARKVGQNWIAQSETCFGCLVAGKGIHNGEKIIKEVGEEKNTHRGPGCQSG